MKQYLEHYGVLGMKWGVRRDQHAKNYSSSQRIRDRKLYGRGAERRINKRMLKGESIQSARHNEVKRKQRVSDVKAVSKTVAKGALAVGGSALAYKFLTDKGVSSMNASQLSPVMVDAGRQFINMLFR